MQHACAHRDRDPSGGTRDRQGRYRRLEKNEGLWEEFLGACFGAFLGSTTEKRFVVFLDTTVVCDGSLPLFGSNPIELELRGTSIDLSPITGRAGVARELHACLENAGQVEAAVAMRRLYAAGKRMQWAFRQLVFVFATFMETTVLDSIRPAVADEPGEVVSLSKLGRGHMTERLHGHGRQSGGQARATVCAGGVDGFLRQGRFVGGALVHVGLSVRIVAESSPGAI